MAKSSTMRCCHRATRFRELLLVLTLILLGGLAVKAAVPIPYVGCTPKDGSTITSFRFELEWDTKAAVDSLRKLGKVDIEPGIGIINSFSFPVNLYEGDVKTGKLLKKYSGTIMKPSSPYFKPGNTLTIDFGMDLYPTPGQKYTLEFGDIRCLFIKRTERL